MLKSSLYGCSNAYRFFKGTITIQNTSARDKNANNTN